MMASWWSTMIPWMGTAPSSSQAPAKWCAKKQFDSWSTLVYDSLGWWHCVSSTIRLALFFITYCTRIRLRNDHPWHRSFKRPSYQRYPHGSICSLPWGGCFQHVSTDGASQGLPKCQIGEICWKLKGQRSIIILIKIHQEFGEGTRWLISSFGNVQQISAAPLSLVAISVLKNLWQFVLAMFQCLYFLGDSSITESPRFHQWYVNATIILSCGGVSWSDPYDPHHHHLS